MSPNSYNLVLLSVETGRKEVELYGRRIWSVSWRVLIPFIFTDEYTYILCIMECQKDKTTATFNQREQKHVSFNSFSTVSLITSALILLTFFTVAIHELGTINNQSWEQQSLLLHRNLLQIGRGLTSIKVREYRRGNQNGQSRKLATQGTQDEEKQTKTQHKNY